MDKLTVDELKDRALAAYQAHLDEEAERDAQAALLRLAVAETEKQQLQEWLATWMPEAAVQFVNLDDYSAAAARRYNHSERESGKILELALPGAYPIRFRVYLREGYEGKVPEFGSWGFGSWENNCFVVPQNATVERDEEGDLFIAYRWWSYPTFADIELAIGWAVAQWQQNAARLQDEWLKMEETAGQYQEAASLEEPPMSWQDRVVAALETIAAAQASTAW